MSTFELGPPNCLRGVDSQNCCSWRDRIPLVDDRWFVTSERLDLDDQLSSLVPILAPWFSIRIDLSLSWVQFHSVVSKTKSLLLDFVLHFLGAVKFDPNARLRIQVSSISYYPPSSTLPSATQWHPPLVSVYFDARWRSANLCRLRFDSVTYTAPHR